METNVHQISVGDLAAMTTLYTNGDKSMVITYKTTILTPWL